MEICYFGIYGPDYTMTRIFREGLKENSLKVIECNSPLPDIPIKATDKLSSIKFYSTLLFYELVAYTKLFFKFIKDCTKCDVILVGFPWEFDVFLAFFLGKIFRKPVVFDIFVSQYNTFVRDRKVFPEGSLNARFCLFKDRMSCRLSDIVLMETIAQKDFFVKMLEVEEKKLKVVYVGGADNSFNPVPKKESKEFKVLFYGTFIPLHGIEYIVEAAKLLEKHKDIKFRIIGTGQIYGKIMGLVENLKIKNIEFIDWVPYEKLPEENANADICLGQFGSSAKGKLFIGFKIFQAAAMKKPIINGDYSAIREVFTHKKDVFLCKTSNSKALAEAILLLKNDEKLRNKIARNAYNLFQARFTTRKIGGELKKILEEAVKNKGFS